MISPRILFEGDPAEAYRYVGVAKEFGRSTFAAGILSKVWRLGEDVHIRVMNNIQARVCKVWIKAGIEWKFIFYPRLVTVGNGGIYTSLTSLFQYPNSFVPNIETSNYYTRFSSLSYRRPPNVLQTKGDLALLSGNQFFFKGNSVYSWWGSPCGDGPEEKVGINSEFVFPARYVWKNSASNIIYKEGDVWVDLRSSLHFVSPYDYEIGFYKIAGMFIGSVSIGESKQSRLVIATYLTINNASRCTLWIHVFKKHTDRWIAVGQHSTEDLIDSLLWPMRFTSDGSHGSVIYKTLRYENGPAVFSFTLATFTFSYGEESTSIVVNSTVTDEPYLTQVGRSSRSSTLTVDFSTSPYAPSPDFLENFTQTTSNTIDLEYEVEQTFTPSSAKLPIALNYNHKNELKVIYANVEYIGSDSKSSFYSESAQGTRTGLCYKDSHGFYPGLDPNATSSGSTSWSKGSSYSYQCNFQLVNQGNDVLFESVLAMDTESSFASGSGWNQTDSNTYSRSLSERRLWLYYLDALTQSYFYESLGAFGEVTESGSTYYRTHDIDLKILGTSVYQRHLTSEPLVFTGTTIAGGQFADRSGYLGVTFYYGRSVSDSDDETTYNPMEDAVPDFSSEMLFVSMNLQTEIEYSVVIDHRIKMENDKTPAWAYSFYMNYNNLAKGDLSINANFLPRFKYTFMSDGILYGFVPHVLCQGQSSFGDLHLHTPTIVNGIQVSESYEPWDKLVYHPIGLI